MHLLSEPQPQAAAVQALTFIPTPDADSAPCKIAEPGAVQQVAKANRANSGIDLAPVLFMIEARWLSTVR